MRRNARLPDQPSVDLEDIERHNLPCVTLDADLPGQFYTPVGRRDGEIGTIPAGSRLVNFFRDVAEVWRAKYGDWFPVDVHFPDGRFLHMTCDPVRLLEIVKTQAPVDWNPETQRYEPRKP